MTPEQLCSCEKRSDSGRFHLFCSSAFTGATQDLSCSPQEQDLGFLKHRALPTLQETGHTGRHTPDLWRYQKCLAGHPKAQNCLQQLTAPTSPPRLNSKDSWDVDIMCPPFSSFKTARGKCGKGIRQPPHLAKRSPLAWIGSSATSQKS